MSSVPFRRSVAGATVLALTLVGVVAAPISASAADFTVTSLADDGSIGTLRSAIAAANGSPGADTVRVTAVGTITLVSPIVITGEVALSGPGADALTITRNGDFELFEIDMLAADQDVVFDAFSLDGGGGAVSGQRAIDVLATIPARDLSITDVEFTAFVTAVPGGALRVEGLSGDFALTGADVHDNVGSSGGTITVANVAGGSTVDASSFTDNEAGPVGGAVHLSANTGPVVVTGSTFTGNAAVNGGAIAIEGMAADVTVSNSTFEFNLATDTSGSSGGGIWVDNVAPGQNLLIQGSTFTRNRAGNAGVSIGMDSVSGAGRADIVNSTFFEEYTSPYAINVGNAAPGSVLNVASDTIVANGAVHVGNVDGDVGISDSIINGNVNGPLWPAVVRDSGSGLILVEWSIVTTPILASSMAAGAGNQFSTDPQVGSLASNGGPTLTMLPVPGSPAINAGDPAYAPGVTTDQRGAARVSQGRVDVGAVEITAVLPATGADIDARTPAGALLLLLVGAGLLMAGRRRPVWPLHRRR